MEIIRNVIERARLAPRWVTQIALLLVLSIAISGLTIVGGVKLGYIEIAQNDESTDVEDDAIEADAAEVALADANAESEEDEDDESSGDQIVEVPESLRPEVPNSFVTSMMSPSGPVELGPTSPQAPKAPTLARDQVLNDVDDRMSKDFKIPEGLRDRVGFWFDIYTKYDSNRRVIHHARYPWIIFKVVDVSPIINNDTPRRLWMRREKADKLVKEEAHQIRMALMRATSKKKIAKPNEYDEMVSKALEPLGGNIRKQASLALHEVRVQTGQRDFFMDGLSVSSRYLTTMEGIFRKHGLPVELTRIPFVESSFNKHATSKVGASGIWQFMGNTGRKFMMVDDNIDERRSPFKATEAAARLLKENHLILHRSWPLAVTAWNHGPGGIRKAAANAGSRDLAKIVARYRSRSFDFASSNFYSEFLGALYAEHYSEEMFGPVVRVPHVDFQVVKLARAVRFNDVMRVVKMSKEEFLLINPELSNAAKKNMLLPKGFRLHVPETSLESLERLFAATGSGKKSAAKGA